MFKPTQKSWISPFLFVTYIATSITGILMLFHIKFPGLYPIHEWGGLAFLVAGILHVIVNWKLFVSYFNKRSLQRNAVLGTVIAIILITLIAFTVPTKNGHGEHGHFHASSEINSSISKLPKNS